MAITLTVQDIRRTLVADGVFVSAGWVDERTLRMFWEARRSPEYQQRLVALKPG
jgi:predicted amidohydrolase